MYHDRNIPKDRTLFYMTTHKIKLNHFAHRLSILEKRLLYVAPRRAARTLQWKTQTALNALASKGAYKLWQLSMCASNDMCVNEMNAYDITAAYQSNRAEPRSNARTCGP